MWAAMDAETKENKMKVYTIKKKMSGTGTIYDIASDQFDLPIKFRKGTKFAVVLSASYGDYRYSTHKTAEAAAKMSDRQARAGYSHAVIDYDGNMYTANGSMLVAD